MKTASKAYHKVRFTSIEHGSTSGLVIPADKLTSIPDVSRLFPMSEAMKMQRFECSIAYETQQDAFWHSFPGELAENACLCVDGVWRRV